MEKVRGKGKGRCGSRRERVTGEEGVEERHAQRGGRAREAMGREAAWSRIWRLGCCRTVQTGTRGRQTRGRRLVEHPPQPGEVEYNSLFMEEMPRQAQQALATHEQ